MARDCSHYLGTVLDGYLGFRAWLPNKLNEPSLCQQKANAKTYGKIGAKSARLPLV